MDEGWREDLSNVLGEIGIEVGLRTGRMMERERMIESCWGKKAERLAEQMHISICQILGGE